MVKPELGTKRSCPNCSARFYDLMKSPAECPKCGHAFDPEVLLKPRRPRPEPPRPVAAAEAEIDLEDAEAEEGEAEEEGIAEEAVLDTEEEDEGAVPDTGTPARKRETPLEEEGLVEVEEEDVEGDDEIEIAEIEEEDGDVSGILDADVEKEEP